MVRRYTSLSLMMIFAFVMLINSANASDPRRIGTFDDWAAFTFLENGNKVCYMASKPKTAEGNYTQRGDIYALITHRPAENTQDVFSYITGYPYKEASEVSINVNSRAFKLFTQDSTAWAADSAADRALAKAVQSGSKMIVKGISKRGTLTTDTFGLKGSTKAYQAISKECGL